MEKSVLNLCKYWFNDSYICTETPHLCVCVSHTCICLMTKVILRNSSLFYDLLSLCWWDIFNCEAAADTIHQNYRLLIELYVWVNAVGGCALWHLASSSSSHRMPQPFVMCLSCTFTMTEESWQFQQPWCVNERNALCWGHNPPFWLRALATLYPGVTEDSAASYS